MPSWLEDFLIVTDTSRRLQIALFAIPVIPSVIVIFGAFQMDGALEAPEPLVPLVASVSESLFYLYLAAALSACIGCIRIAAKEYRRAHKRLFG